MKDTTSELSNRLTQVAEELHKLADSIGAGQMNISGVELTLSDSVTLKVKQKMTGTKVVLDLKIQALLALEDTRPEIKKGKQNKPVKRIDTHSKGSKRPYDVKTLKKKYTGLWREISSQIKKGKPLHDRLIVDLDALSKEYAESASPKWAMLWQEFETLVGRCISCGQKGDFATANELLQEISRAKKNCHKMYK